MFVFANAGADAVEHFVVQAIVDALHRLAEHIRTATALIADNFCFLPR